MDEFIQHLTDVLQQLFPGSTPELEQFQPLTKVGGFLIWDGFEGVEQLDRQRQVHAALRQTLSQVELQQVTTILTATPEEVELMKAD